MTHAILALLQGDVRRAWRHNPFVLLLIPLLAWGITDALRRLPVVWQSLLEWAKVRT